MAITIYDNNLSARTQVLLDKVYGKADFGDPIRPKRVANLSEFPKEARPMVEKLTGGKTQIDQFELQRKMYDAIEACMSADKGFLGIFPGDHKISPKEERRAARHNADVKPFMDWIHQTW